VLAFYYMQLSERNVKIMSKTPEKSKLKPESHCPKDKSEISTPLIS
jgi:hypothetical protein